MMAQNRGMGGRSLYSSEPAEPFFAETRAMPVPGSPDSLQIFLLFRIQYTALHFQNAPSGDVRGTLCAFPVLQIECRDSNGVIRNRSEWKDTVFARNYEQSKSKKEFSWGMMVISLLKGTYSLNVQMSEKNGQFIGKVKLPACSLPTNGVIQPYFTESKGISIFVPSIMNGSVPFSKGSLRAVFPIIAKVKNGAEFILRRVAQGEFASGWNVKNQVAGKVNIIPDAAITYNKMDLRRALPDLRLESDTARGLMLGEIVFPEDAFAPGQYILEILLKNKEKTDTNRFEFACEWENIPLSLSYLRFAVESMQYILTDEEFDKINSGSDPEKRAAMLQWWNKKDPTPSTPYNEAMAEYYRRVDQCFLTFQTILEQDGTKTERGKIAILHGFPQKVEKNILPGNILQEIWIYSAVIKKKFIFEQPSGGVFKLKKIETL
jgi:GWxTD domain-containing protein